MAKHSVFLVEDNHDTRERLASAIRNHPQLKLAAEAATFTEAMAYLEKNNPGVMLTDLGLPDGDGRDLIRYVTDKGQGTEVMVITVFGDEKHVMSAIEAGASGYLLKDGGDIYIGDSIVQMIEGQSPVSPAIARHLLKRFRSFNAPKETTVVAVPKLTPREGEILQYVAKGFSFVEVARLLEMSPHTVTHHIKNIYKKLAVCSRAEAVFEAMQLGLVRMDG